MSRLNLTRRTFLEKEELARFQQFLADSPSENAIIGNTSKWGILRTDFATDTDFLVEPSANAGRVKIEKAENKAIAKGGKMIHQEAIDNIEVPNDNKWYWMRIKYKYVTYEKGTVSINSSGQVIGTGTSFRDVLRGQATLVPTKVKFLKLDGSQAVNSGFYEVVDITDNNITLTSAIDFVAESNLRMVVLGTTPLGEMLSTEQQEGLYKYDSCEIELIPEDVEDSETPPHLSTVNPDLTFIQDKMFYISRVKNNSGFVEVDNNNPHVRAEFWEFNVVGLTDKLSIYNNLSDLSNVVAARDNLDVYGKSETYHRASVDTIISERVEKTKILSDLNNTGTARANLDVYGKSETYSKSEVDDRTKQSSISPNISCTSSSATITKVYAKMSRAQFIWVVNCKFTYSYSGETNPVFSFSAHISNLDYLGDLFIDVDGIRTKAEVISFTPLSIKVIGTYPSGTRTITINHCFSE